MSNPDLALSARLYRLTRHNRTISQYTLDTILQTSLLSKSPSRPSTASTTSSFSTAFSSLEAGSPFRYYLPHISTPTSPVYTRNEKYACNLAPSSRGVQIQAGLFYHYIPSESTEQSDVYTNDFDNVLSAPAQLPRKPKEGEQKALQSLKGVVFAEPRTPVEVKSPLSHIGPFDFPYHPGRVQDEGVDVGSYTAGETLDTCKTAAVVDNSSTKRQRKKLTKDQDRKFETKADVSKKVKKMLRKLHLGRKPSGQW